MKTTKLFMLIVLLTMAMSIQAQVSVNVNIGTPPVWAPAAPVEVQYYYLPDIQMYYDVPARRYIYLRNGAWVRSAYLPSRYRGYDLYHGKTVYLTDYRGNAPYSFYNVHRVKYHGNGNWKKVRYVSVGQSEHGRGERHNEDHGNGKGHGHGKK